MIEEIHTNYIRTKSVVDDILMRKVEQILDLGWMDGGLGGVI